MTTTLRVAVLVDWDSARRIAPKPSPQSIESITQAFFKLQDKIADLLTSDDNKSIFKVHWRMYHGWHQGKTKTPDRLVFEKFAMQFNSRRIKRVSFGCDFEFGDLLKCHSRRAQLYDTLRVDSETKQYRQKMVDTALACDLLHMVRTQDSSRYYIVGGDDDLVPIVITAESWKAKVCLLRLRKNENKHLNLSGILRCLGDDL